MYSPDSTSATLVDKDGKVTHMVPSEGNMYRLPCIEDEHGQDLEVHAGMLKWKQYHLIRVVIFPGGAIQDYPAAKDPKTKRTTEICPL